MLEAIAEIVMHAYFSAISIMEQVLVSPIVAIAQVVLDPFLKITILTIVEKQIVNVVAKVEVEA